MKDYKMGFKHTMLQRLNSFQTMTAGQTSPSLGSDDGQPTTNTNANITDFSISRILGNEKTEENKSKHSTAPDNGIDILDLSKTRTHVTANTQINVPNQYSTTTSKTTTNTTISPQCLNSFELMQADFISATKFYAQFLPHMHPHYNIPACTSAAPTGTLPKKYFAPYVLHTTPTNNETRPDQTTTLQKNPQPIYYNASKSKCSLMDCYECSVDCYKQLPLKPKAIIPRTTSASIPLPQQLVAANNETDLLINTATTLTLTSVTKTNLTRINATKCTSLSGSSSQTVGHQEEISYKCRICDKVFGCLQTLQAHEKTHKSPRYECTDCGKGFSQLRNYKYHISVHRGTKEFAAECPECGKTFNDKGYLSSHMKIHRNKKEYECPYCPKSFNQRVAFNMHVRIHTGVKPHKCAECGKRFSRKMLLKQHMRTHSGEKPYQCSVCGKSFADRSNMTLHHRLHSGIKPFSCPICPKAFTKKHHLKTHLNYHTGCKPYVCPHPNCNQAFTQSSNMRTHAKKCQFKPLEYPAFAENEQLHNSSFSGNASTPMRLDNLSALNSTRLLIPNADNNSQSLWALHNAASMLTSPTTHTFPFVQQTLMSTTATKTTKSKLRPS